MIAFLLYLEAKQIADELLCQFPYSGSYHFYLVCKAIAESEDFVCQFSYSGSYHFYFHSMEQAIVVLLQCVNSLIRVSFISSIAKKFQTTPSRVCQFPYSDTLHFYGEQPFVMIYDREVCQFPYSGTLISTVASHSPLKSRLLKLIFVGNCRNILTMKFLGLLFCLFKYCTNINTILPVKCSFILTHTLSHFNKKTGILLNDSRIPVFNYNHDYMRLLIIWMLQLMYHIFQTYKLY